MSRQIKPPTILVVADNPTIRFWVKKHLDDDFFILHAESRQEAISALNASLDFIIVDGAITAFDPLELCKDLSIMTQKTLVPILLITGRLKKSFRDRATACGVSDFLSDQLDIEELRMRIATGKKTASARQRTEDLALKIKVPKMAATSLKDKFLLTDPALRLLANAKNEGTPIALLLLRVDNNTAVENLPDFINGFLRKNDLLLPAPDGGFAILLSNMTPDKGRQVAENLRKVIEKHSFDNKHITVSIAVSSLEASEKGFNKMIESAVKSLKTQTDTNLIISIDPESL
jgi:PleD family two-component response regulator